MADNLYETLIGEPPVGTDQKLIAEMLRRRRAFGELGAITGDPVLQPFGQGLIKQADTYTEGLQKTRQKAIDDAQTKAFQTGQLEHMSGVLAESIRAQDIDTETTRRGQDMTLLAAMERVGAKGARKMTDTSRNKILQHADTLSAISDQLSGFSPEYTQILGAGPQSRLPNLAAQAGIGTAGSKEAQEWWANWSRFYTLPVRNLLFGATLTPNEQAAWRQADINPAMSSEQIKERIGNLIAQSQGSAKRRAKTMVVEGFDPEILEQAYGDVVPDLFDDTGTSAGHGRKPTKEVNFEDLK